MLAYTEFILFKILFFFSIYDLSVKDLKVLNIMNYALRPPCIGTEYNATLDFSHKLSPSAYTPAMYTTQTQIWSYDFLDYSLDTPPPKYLHKHALLFTELLC